MTLLAFVLGIATGALLTLLGILVALLLIARRAARPIAASAEVDRWRAVRVSPAYVGWDGREWRA